MVCIASEKVQQGYRHFKERLKFLNQPENFDKSKQTGFYKWRKAKITGLKALKQKNKKLKSVEQGFTNSSGHQYGENIWIGFDSSMSLSFKTNKNGEYSEIYIDKQGFLAEGKTLGNSN